jgi:signal transduction histidine kinase/CheY-like chemotaxis protein
LFRNCPPGVAGAWSGASLLAVALWRTGRCGAIEAMTWIALLTLCVAVHLTLCVAHARSPAPDAAWRRWLWIFTAVAAVEGAVWFIGAFWMTSPTNLTQELLVLLVSSAIGSAAVPVFGAYLPTFFLFFLPAMLPHIWFGLERHYQYHWILAAMIFAYMFFMILIARHGEARLIEGLRLRFENADLAAGLRIQTEAALRANAEKSLFLAAASHDLRQPIHALSLFLGALQAEVKGERARRLIAQMDSSVGALDDLFSALLDISKLDAGVVEPRMTAVPLAPLLDRLGHEYGTLAATKGLALRLRPIDVTIGSDPVLLERVLRNLIANAVRYTEEGGILVGCRRRRDAIVVEVWDTGIGIAPADQETVFQEFRQVGNPDRDRSKGLGLGLAIVRRIAPLIHAEVGLSSVLRRGSVFRLSLPLWTGALPTPEAAEMLDSGLSDTGLILVIDDERDVRLAMTALLQSWGVHFLIAASPEDAVEQLREQAASPSLIVSDYRLRDGVTGIEAIRMVRLACGGQDIPALLITGDTAPGRLEEIRTSGFPVLHKPVANAKLRVAIRNLTRPAALAGEVNRAATSSGLATAT